MDLSGKLHPDYRDKSSEAGDDSVQNDAVQLAEEELVNRARRGDEVAWTTLVRRHQEPVFRLAYLMLGGRPDRTAAAEDVAQEAFVRAYLKLDQFESGRPLRPWLLAIAANLARNWRRSVGRYWAALRRWWDVQRVEKEAATPAQEKRDDAQMLWQAIQQLSADHQEALYLRYFLDMTEAEMAEVLDVAAGTVKSRLYRARRSLADVLRDDFPALYKEWGER